MAKKKKQGNMQKRQKELHLGKLEPRHQFFLNPYADYRFIRCPACGAKTKMWKRPFLVHIDPQTLFTFNMTTPYCESCDLIIMHQNVLEHHLIEVCEARYPEIIGNGYLVMGTVDPEALPKDNESMTTMGNVLDHTHDFEKHVQYAINPVYWEVAGKNDAES